MLRIGDVRGAAEADIVWERPQVAGCHSHDAVQALQRVAPFLKIELVAQNTDWRTYGLPKMTDCSS